MCETCSAEFTEKRNLIRHQRIFHKEQRILYVCNTCGRGFPRFDNLKRHEKTQHTPKREMGDGEERFVCAECQAHFLLKEQLDAHRKTHLQKETYLCHKCGRVFHQSETFTKHFRKQCGKVPPISSTRKRKHIDTIQDQPRQSKSKFYLILCHVSAVTILYKRRLIFIYLVC